MIHDNPAAGASIACDWLRRDSRLRILATRDAAVVWSNRGDDAGPADDGGIGLIDGRPLAKPVRDLVESVGPMPRSVVLPAHDAAGYVLVRGWAAGDADDHVCLEIASETAALPASFDDLAPVFHLTPAEHRVLVRLLDGLPVPLLAAAIGVSVDTARTHVRRVYQKLGVRSREELFRKLRPFFLG